MPKGDPAAATAVALLGALPARARHRGANACRPAPQGERRAVPQPPAGTCAIALEYGADDPELIAELERTVQQIE